MTCRSTTENLISKLDTNKEFELLNFVPAVRKEFPLQSEVSYHFTPVTSTESFSTKQSDQHQIDKSVAESWYQNGDNTIPMKRRRLTLLPDHHYANPIAYHRSDNVHFACDEPLSLVNVKKEESPVHIRNCSYSLEKKPFVPSTEGNNVEDTDDQKPSIQFLSEYDPELQESKALKEGILQAIGAVEKQIAQIESQKAVLLRKLTLKTESISSSEDRHDVLESSAANSTHSSLAQIIYSENKRKAHEGYDLLSKFGSNFELPVYNQPADTKVLHKNREKYLTFKKHLQNYIRKKQLQRSKLEIHLTKTYEKLAKDWDCHLEKIENASKGDKGLKMREFFEKQFPEIKHQREEKERFLRAAKHVRSDADLKDIMDGLQEQEIEGRKQMKNCAVLPPTFSNCSKQMKFINKNGFVSDPLTEYQDRMTVLNLWTSEEKDVFWRNFLIYSKNFPVISSFLESKNVADCVHFYYLTKKTAVKLFEKSSLKKRGKTELKIRSRSFTGSYIQLQPKCFNNLLLEPFTAIQGLNNNIAEDLSKTGGTVVWSHESISPNNEVTKPNWDRVDGLKSPKNTIFQPAKRQVEPCALCGLEPSNVIDCRPVTIANHILYGLSEDCAASDMWVCAPCHFRMAGRKHTYCPIPTCQAKEQRVKKLYSFPMWNQICSKLKTKIIDFLQIPINVHQCCFPCYEYILQLIEENKSPGAVYNFLVGNEPSFEQNSKIDYYSSNQILQNSVSAQSSLISIKDEKRTSVRDLIFQTIEKSLHFSAKSTNSNTSLSICKVNQAESSIAICPDSVSLPNMLQRSGKDLCNESKNIHYPQYTSYERKIPLPKYFEVPTPEGNVSQQSLTTIFQEASICAGDYGPRESDFLRTNDKNLTLGTMYTQSKINNRIHQIKLEREQHSSENHLESQYITSSNNSEIKTFESAKRSLKFPAPFELGQNIASQFSSCNSTERHISENPNKIIVPLNKCFQKSVSQRLDKETACNNYKGREGESQYLSNGVAEESMHLYFKDGPKYSTNMQQNMPQHLKISKGNGEMQRSTKVFQRDYKTERTHVLTTASLIDAIVMKQLNSSLSNPLDYCKSGVLVDSISGRIESLHAGSGNKLVTSSYAETFSTSPTESNAITLRENIVKVRPIQPQSFFPPHANELSNSEVLQNKSQISPVDYVRYKIAEVMQTDDHVRIRDSVYNFIGNTGQQTENDSSIAHISTQNCTVFSSSHSENNTKTSSAVYSTDSTARELTSIHW